MLALRRLAHSHAARRALLVGTALLLVTTSVELVPPRVFAMTSVPAVEAVAPVPALTSASARPTPTEVTSLRSAYSDTFDNHNGTYTAHISPSPINYRPSGSTSWSPIDLTFVSVNSAGRLGVSKTPAPIQVGSPTDAAGFVSVATPEGTIDLRLPSATAAGNPNSKPTTSAVGLAYLAGLLPSADLEVLAEPNGARTYLVLASAPASNAFSFNLDCGALTPLMQADGSISFVDGSNSIVATMPAPMAVDSTPNAGLGGGDMTMGVSYSLSGSGSNTLLTVTVDRSFLANATYPVYVDPTVTLDVPYTNDTFISSKYPTTNYNTYARPDSPYYHELLLGTDPSDSSSTYYSLLKWSYPSSVMHTLVDSATIQIYPYWQYMHYQAVTTWVDRVTSTWAAGSVTYNTRPTHVALTSFTTKQGQMASVNVTAAAQDWVNGASNYGVELHENGNGGTYWKRLIASEQGGADVPVLVITYHTPVVSGLTPTAAAWTSSRALSWAFSDPDGSIQNQFELVLATTSNFTSPLIDTGAVTSAQTTYSIPATTGLTDGTTYYWEVKASNGAGVPIWSPYVSGSFKWDHTAPTWSGFTAPASQVDQSGSSYTFAWTAAGGGATIASYELQLQTAPISATANTCVAAWANVGNPVTLTTTSYAASSLSDVTCYRVGVSATDAAGNSGTWNYSSPLLRDASAPGAPVVVDDATVAPSRYGNNYTIYFWPATPRTLTLTSTGLDGESGIASSTFGTLSAPTGWTYTASTVTGNSASTTIRWSATAGQTTLPVTTKNGAGANSATTTLTFVPLTGSVADFATPDEGTTSVIKPTDTFSVAWAEYAYTGGVTARSLQRQTEAPDANGLCTPANWTNDGSPSMSVSPVSASGLTGGSCYRWTETLTDSQGPHAFNSGAVVVDGTVPTATLAYPETGRAIGGTESVTGTASDTHLSSYVLAYGAGTSPSTWTSFAASPNAVSSQGTLGAWATFGLAGVYTLRLTATDYAGNATVATDTLYLDNTERGDETYYTSMPFDLGGGWNLGVQPATGEATLSRDLFSIPSYGPAQSLSVSYNSGDTGTGGQLGQGWSSNLTQYLSFESGFVVWHRADGGRVPFGQIGGIWTALAGHYEKLSSGTGTCGQASSTCVITMRDQSSLTFEGSGGGRLTAITDRFGQVLTLSWGTSSATATDASGRATTIAIDSVNHRITDVTDSAGRHWGFQYAGSNLACITDPVSSNPTCTTNPASNATTLTYNGSGQLTGVSRVRTPYQGSAQTIAWSIGYTGSQVTSVTDPIGATTSPVTSSEFVYASGSTSVKILRDASVPASPIYNVGQSSFDSHGRATWSGDPDGWGTTNVYDTNGNLTSTSRQINATDWALTTNSFDTAGNLTDTTVKIDATHSTTTHDTYDATNDLLTETRDYGAGHLNSLTAYVYDSGGHLCRKVENPQPTNETIACTGTLGQSTDPPDYNVDTQYTYNASNELATETDANGIVTAYGYDTYGNRTSVTQNYIYGQQPDDSTNVTTTYAFDQNTTAGKAGLATSTTVPITTVGSGVSRTTTDLYDPFGNVTSEIVAGDSNVPSQKTLTSYDEFGNLVHQEHYSPSGSATPLSYSTTTYDSCNRSTGVTNWASYTNITTTTTSSYDMAGDELASVADDTTATVKAYDGLGQPLAAQPSSQDATTHVYDGPGREITTVAPTTAMGTTTTNDVFDLAGQMTKQTVDAYGQPDETDIVYNLLGQETSSTDQASGLQTTTSYDHVGRVTQTVSGTVTTTTTYDKGGRATQVTVTSATGTTTTSSTYDNLNRVHVRVVDSGGTNATTTTTYDAAGDAVAVVDPKNVETDMTYAVDGSLISRTVHDPSGDVTATNTYSSSGTKTTATATVAGVTTQTDYDGAGRVLDTIVDPGTGHLALETDYAYDSYGRQVRTSGPSGVLTYTVYDSQGRVCRTVQNATLDPSTLTRPCSDAISSDGTVNMVTTFGYDDAGNKTSVTAPNGTTTAYTYDNLGNVTSQIADYVAGYAGTDPTVNVETDYYYDAAGRRVATKAPTASGSFAITLNQYDASGNLTTEILNCTSSGTAPTSGDLSNPQSCTGGGIGNGSTNIRTTYAYDNAGNRTEMDAPSPANSAGGTALITTLYVYDANNRLCRVIENASVSNPTCSSTISSTATTNVVMAYDYDANGNLADQTAPAPEGHTGYVTDDLGRLASQTDAKGNTTSWTYDGVGDKLTEADPDGQHVYWSYDTAGQLCRRTAFNAGASPTWPSDPCADVQLSGTPPAVDTHYEHDNAGNQTKAKDELAGYAITTSYDALGRPLSVSGDASGDPATTYTYDFNNPTRTDASGAYTFTLDDYGREVGLIDPLHPNNPYAWTYAATGAVASMTDPTANVTTNTYDSLNRLTARSTTGSSGCTNCASLTDTYNDADNIVSSASTITGSGANGTTTYAYDALDRLTNFTPPSAIQRQDYTSNGSPDRATVKIGSNPTLTMSYDDASRLSFDSGGGTYAYDGQGRLTAMPGATLTYDALGRLISVSGANSATYTYDVLDRLRTVTEGGTTTRFLYVGLTNAVAQDSNTSTGITNHATDMAGTDLFDFNSTGNVSGYLGRNVHDDIVWTASSTGAVNATLTYDPFGTKVASTGSTLPNTRWQSSWQDPRTGLFYVIARWYAPSLGVFLSDDPIAHDQAAPQYRSVYAYGGGDPIMSRDPDGGGVLRLL
jgi:RHS repeat-associated protein